MSKEKDEKKKKHMKLRKSTTEVNNITIMHKREENEYQYSEREE
jgi:hypothetical protein